MLDKFIAEYSGRIVSFDNVATNAGQSLQLVAQWCRFIGLPFQWATPYSWWDDSDDTFLEHWQKVVNNRKDAKQLPKPGDIIIFDTSLPGSGGQGHASIFIQSIGPNSWQGFDANWGGKSAHLQSHNFSYVLGWFRPRNSGVYEGNPTPLADEAPSDPYEVEDVEAKSITLKNNALLYNLTDVDWESFQANPQAQGQEGQDLIVTALARHRLGGAYYLPDPSKPYGYRLSDCDDYSGHDPLPPPEEKVGQKKAKLPLAPLMAPILKAIEIEKDIPRYASMGDAINKVNSTGVVPAGTYYPHKYLEDMVCLSKEPGHVLGWWIDPFDLLSAEEKLKLNWRTTYKPFRDQYGNVEPRYYQALNDDPIPDLETKRKDLAISQGQPILIRGWFQGPDGGWYGRPDACVSQGELMWYGVRRANLERIPDPTLKSVPREPEMVIVATSLPSLRAKIESILPTSVSRIFDITKPKAQKGEI